MANTIEFEGFEPQQRPECAVCEAMLADAVDGLLSAEDQAWLDRHVAGCVDCSNSMADAQRGAAWLEILKNPRPEPSAMLLDRILAQTSGRSPAGQELSYTEQVEVMHPGVLPFVTPVIVPTMGSNVLQFRSRMQQRFSRAGRMMAEPRLAMTAAMAFFSIALTMNLAGVQLNQLHASDLKPANLERNYYEAKAQAVRSYESLRVVHVVESRVDDLRDSSGLNAEQERLDQQRLEQERQHQLSQPPEQNQQDKDQEEKKPGGVSLRQPAVERPERLARAIVEVESKTKGGLA